MTTTTGERTGSSNALDRSNYWLNVTAQFESHDTFCTAFCNELPLVGTGATEFDALVSLSNCIREYLRLSDEWGILGQVMSDYGYTAHNPSINIFTEHFDLKLPSTMERALPPVEA